MPSQSSVEQAAGIKARVPSNNNGVYLPLKLIAYQIIVTFGRVACYQFTDETGEEKLQSHDHTCQRKVEVNRVCDIEMIGGGTDADYLEDKHDEDSQETDYEHQ